jgi:hypothetical protein
VTRAAREANEAVVALGEKSGIEAGVQALVRMRRRQEAAEVRVAARGFDQEGDM